MTWRYYAAWSAVLLFHLVTPLLSRSRSWYAFTGDGIAVRSRWQWLARWKWARACRKAVPRARVVRR